MTNKITTATRIKPDLLMRGWHFGPASPLLLLKEVFVVECLLLRFLFFCFPRSDLVPFLLPRPTPLPPLVSWSRPMSVLVWCGRCSCYALAFRFDSVKTIVSKECFFNPLNYVEYPALLGIPTLQEVSRMEARWI